MHPVQYRGQIDAWLHEDLGRAGDLTSEAIADAAQRANANLVARAGGVIAGLDIALEVFRALDPDLAVSQMVTDGQVVAAGTVLAELSGNARAILGAERTALNLLGRLSGIATATRAITDAVSGSGAVVADTRKTTPGLRMLEKHAVRMGGGINHRFGLGDAVLVKDNHVALAGSVTAAVKAVRSRVGHTVKIEVEVDTLQQVEELLRDPVDIVLLDNMSPDELCRAVALINGQMITEASGGITIDTAAEVAATGVDILSIGWVTHSAPSLDVALDVQFRGAP